MRTSGIAPVHEVGVYGSPQWRISQRLSPDDAWEVETLPGGRLPSANLPVPEQFEWAYLTWAEGTRAESGADVLLTLPPGRYLLVRSELEPHRAARVVLGNEYVPDPPANLAVLLDERPFYGVVLGRDGARPPVTAHPLIGLIALNSNGHSLNSAFSLDCRAGEAGGVPSGDLVLVLPVTGELVIDALAGFHTEEQAMRDKNRWRDTLADGLANALTG